MGAGNFSLEVSVLENGKLVRGTLTVFKDEYVFGGQRIAAHWDRVSCEQGTEKIKAFLRAAEKPYVVLREGETQSPRFFAEPKQLRALLDAVAAFAAQLSAERAAKEEAARREQEERRLQAEREARLREQAEEEARRRREDEERQKAEQARQAREEQSRRVADKRARIQKELERCRAAEPETVTPGPFAAKAAACVLQNPFRILGVSCLASNEEANAALDKLKKMARLKALAAYRSPFDLAGLERPARELSVAQNALVQLKDNTHRFFWFAEPDACAAWQSGRYRMELTRDGEALGTYDLFLANYLYAMVCDPDFQTAETWKRVLRYAAFLCSPEGGAQLRGRFTEKELQGVSDEALVRQFGACIFKPVLQLCDRDDLDAVIRLHKYIRECEDERLKSLGRSVVSRLVSWFTDREAAMFAYLREWDSEESIPSEKGAEICARGEEYCRVVEPVFELVLRDFRGDAVRYEMIKESFRHTTYQFMYVLNKCADKSDAIVFANKCYGYCNADDKKRIQNTFGEANIKSIDWNNPHTIWDAKGDDFYFGRGRPADYAQALYWYRRAAEAGNMYSMNSIGVCYREGHGMPQDDRQAAEWFRKAYEAGCPQGAYNYAECWFSGVGVNQSVEQALRYWAEAEKLGHPSAAQRREAVFSVVQAERKRQRAHSHVCHDVGFQMTTGPSLAVEVTLSRPAYVYLVNAQGYQNYLNGNDFRSFGGYASSSPYFVRIPSSNHWYVIVDSGDQPFDGLKSSVKVKRA